MSKDEPVPKSKGEPSKKGTKISPADDLTKTSKSGDIELDEEELKRISGGAGTQDVK
jgi:bacteriocin-like protein